VTASINPDEKPVDVDPLNDESSFPLLPRQAWRSQLAYLKAILKAKQALDRSEKLDTSEI
jgi:hypothetical protein